eukprot:UN11244
MMGKLGWPTESIFPVVRGKLILDYNVPLISRGVFKDHTIHIPISIGRSGQKVHPLTKANR